MGFGTLVLLSPVDGDQAKVVPPVACNCALPPPEQMVVSFPAFARTGIETVTTTVSASVQPETLVTVTIYEVVVAGLATGFATVVLLSPAAGDHPYVIPPLAAKLVLDPGHIVTSTPAFALIVPLTEIIT